MIESTVLVKKNLSEAPLKIILKDSISEFLVFLQIHILKVIWNIYFSEKLHC